MDSYVPIAEARPMATSEQMDDPTLPLPMKGVIHLPDFIQIDIALHASERGDLQEVHGRRVLRIDVRLKAIVAEGYFYREIGFVFLLFISLNLRYQAIAFRFGQSQMSHTFKFSALDEVIERFHRGIGLQVRELETHLKLIETVLLDPKETFHRGRRDIQKGILLIVELEIAITRVVLDTGFLGLGIRAIRNLLHTHILTEERARPKSP